MEAMQEIEKQASEQGAKWDPTHRTVSLEQRRVVKSGELVAPS